MLGYDGRGIVILNSVSINDKKKHFCNIFDTTDSMYRSCPKKTIYEADILSEIETNGFVQICDESKFSSTHDAFSCYTYSKLIGAKVIILDTLKYRNAVAKKNSKLKNEGFRIETITYQGGGNSDVRVTFKKIEHFSCKGDLLAQEEPYREIRFDRNMEKSENETLIKEMDFLLRVVSGERVDAQAY